MSAIAEAADLRGSRNLKLAETLQQVGYVVIAWAQIDAHWRAMLAAMTPATPVMVAAALIGEQRTTQGLRDLICNVGRESWAAKSSALVGLRSLKTRTDELAAIWAATLGRTDYVVTAGRDGVVDLYPKTGPSRKPQPVQASVSYSLIWYSTELRQLEADTWAFMAAIAAVGSAVNGCASLMTMIDQNLGLTHLDGALAPDDGAAECSTAAPSGAL